MAVTLILLMIYKYFDIFCLKTKMNSDTFFGRYFLNWMYRSTLRIYISLLSDTCLLCYFKFQIVLRIYILLFSGTCVLLKVKIVRLNISDMCLLFFVTLRFTFWTNSENPYMSLSSDTCVLTIKIII